MEKWGIFRSLTETGIVPIAVGVFASLLCAFFVGCWLRLPTIGAGETSSSEESQEGLIVSAVLVVVGLFLGFTFSLSLQRFEERRMLVLTEANAIGTAYLRAQLLDEPDRSRLSDLLVSYVDNRIALAAGSGPAQQQRLARNDDLVRKIWAAVSAALDTEKGRALATPLTFSFNELIDVETERRVARTTRLPGLVLLMLYLFLIATAGVVGFVLSGKRQRFMAVIMFVLLTLAISVIVDLNRPTSGTILESQEPMMMARALLIQPRSDFDQFKRART